MTTLQDSQAGKPLNGVLVIAMEQAVAAPLCTARLGDAGARVIKLERDGGDFARSYDNAAAGDSSYFAWLNHGKESLTLNYKREDDAALLRALLAKADVFVQNLSPGTLARHGFSDAQLLQDNPSLITCNISGYGDSEAVRKLKAYDLLVQAESGLLAVSGAPGAPGRIGVSLCDIGCGVTAHAGILEALIQRGITGVGSTVNVSLFDVAAEWMSVPLVHEETGDGAPVPVGLRHPSIAPYGAYETSEGALTLLSIQNEAEWQRLCEVALKIPELLDDSRFSTNVERVEHRDALELLLQNQILQFDATDFRERLSHANLAFGALNSVAELAQHRALRRRDIISTSGELLSLPAHPIHRSFDAVKGATEDEVKNIRKIPSVGEHNEAIRREFTQ